MTQEVNIKTIPFGAFRASSSPQGRGRMLPFKPDKFQYPFLERIQFKQSQESASQLFVLSHFRTGKPHTLFLKML
jgi:hypothetical protein